VGGRFFFFVGIVLSATMLAVAAGIFGKVVVLKVMFELVLLLLVVS